ncbi:PPi dependent phosphofructokinase (plasmid) [Legionella adelaidensis]|uniref:Pyrophosphate--fructose 6-phosphate 1-phosphotransferase n=1 Tax=Legionella adelaidensis TaxID=45056 RepID=A0A0W0R344_9GAMM|nr:6-phosphofructokinase [Legionella adelaidensis]KTC65476.1 PPi dependent phosphofructokinase [Legionella adelaidensis]VEH84703.1 PPi dependent phosphofructokinase [Legionella adelaidensis]
MTIKNALYAQSGGVTAVINASACGVIQTARLHPEHIGKVFAAKDGIIGALEENLIDTSLESDDAISKLMHTPSGAFGSCRFKLRDEGEEYSRLLEVFKAHNIGYFFYNGGGDSMDTADKVARMSQALNFPVTCIGIPKTVDNDLPFTDTCPGFGSVAKYVAVSTMEAGFDVASMCASSTKVFILEVMGRHAGWIAAASGLASKKEGEPPHLILFPEIPFNQQKFVSKVDACVKKYGYCVVVASEGIRDENKQFLSESGSRDAFGHAQLGGVAPVLAKIVKTELNLKYHWAVADYLQRAARHIASRVDVEQAYALGKEAVKLAISGHNAIMPIIVRENAAPYQWSIDHVPLSEVANQEKKMPAEFISSDGMGITEECRQYLNPLIQGEAYPPFVSGIPDYVRLKNQLVQKKLF